MTLLLFENPLLVAEYERMQSEAKTQKESLDRMGWEGDDDAPIVLKSCRKCDGFGICPCCERECLVCFGHGKVVDDDAMERLEIENMEHYLTGIKPAWRDCVSCGKAFREYASTPRLLCEHCLKEGKAWLTAIKA